MFVPEEQIAEPKRRKKEEGAFSQNQNVCGQQGSNFVLL